MAAAEPGGVALDAMTWPEVAERAARTVVAVPVGSTEQHGPHLPLSTDTDVAVTLARALAAARPDVVVAPAIAYGSSGEHAGFPGTLSIGRDALEAMLLELGRSADAFSGVVFVSAHGGNAVPVANAVRRLRAEGRHVTAWSPGSADDAHAGRTETSVVMAMAPAAVRASRAAAGNTAPLSELMPALVAHGVSAVSANGVLGDPAGATAGDGARVLAEWSRQLVAAVEDWP